EDHVVEYRMIAADGRVVWFSDFVHLIRHEDERVRWLHGVMVDITESKLAAEASRALGEVGRLLALSPDRAAVAQRIAEGVRHLFGARVATLLTMTSDADGAVTEAHVEGASGELCSNGGRPPGTGVLDHRARQLSVDGAALRLVQRGAPEVEELVHALVLVIEPAALGRDEVVELVGVLHRAAEAEQVGVLKLLTEVALEVGAPLRDLDLRVEACLLPLATERLGDLLVAL